MGTPKPFARLAILCAVLVAGAGWRAETAAAPAGGAEPGNQVARDYFTDTVLVDQDGRELRFYSDLLAGKVVVINSMFTDCTGSCPVMSKKLQALQEHLGDRVGRDVHLISITVDPETDTPARLKEHAAKFGAGPGWHLLTGSEENVKTVLTKLGQWAEDREAHETIFLVGNDRTGLWKKAFALAKTEDVVEIVDSVVEDPGAPG
jgi:protein SCO1/2